MKRIILLIFCICSAQTFYSQEDDDGVVSLDIPARNSLTFNRFNINPTFSFVREQTTTISFNNKREWVQFENAPVTYFGSYSGRFAENIGAGIGVFQQNYGILTTFGGLLNFAYNARIGSVNNLTFGLNVGAYKSGINTANIVTNFDDPSLQNVPEHTLLTINPGINLGTEYLDFGLSINNLALYNFSTSSLVEVNPEQSIEAHIMYTGYMDSKGFFDESKFSGLLKADIYENKTIISALAMVTIPKGFWVQGGYNSLYGATVGAGISVTKNIALEYNYENAIGKLGTFGNSHDFTIAYRFEKQRYYDYSPQDEMTSILSKDNRRRVVPKSKTKEDKAKKEAEQKAKEEAQVQAKLDAEQKAKDEALAQAKLDAEQKAKDEALAQAKLDAEQKAKEEALAQAKLAAEQKAKEEALAQAKLAAEQKAKEEALAQAKLAAEQKAKEEALAQAKLAAEQKAKEEALAQAKLAAEQKAKEEALAQAKLAAEHKAKEEALAQAKLDAEQKAKEEALAQAKLDAEQKAKEEAQAILDAEEQKTNEEDIIENPKDELAQTMKKIAKSTEDSKETQNDLLKQFDEIVTIKNNDLKDLKEENDLGDQGITVEPKPFKSVTAENNKLNAIKTDLEKVILTRNDKIEELTQLYNERAEIEEFALDEVNLFYKAEIDKLKTEQLEANKTKLALDTKLESIKIATEVEKRRRIKRAAYSNEEDRYNQDRSLLQNIKTTTSLNETAYTPEDFDYGEDLGSNIIILKNIDNVESGYYLIIAVHSDIKRRNDFVTKVVSAGRTDIDFFHDVSTSKYYIFYEKFDNIKDANNALKTKGNRPYNGKMSIVKIEN
ncbi:PorP/SprF family type IX secretion system membrane protein [Winogradskyella eckloniae]|uniref:PorP/SprF family type IX secretion system membrane protein n=1 Tax=Winogradskyella eckloniae TaxID=1089306 RepID=UPI00156686F5|nr:PorP/SprF family type IX secretion system membrane protein [Winogradskyella eckloniae]NRD20018.1 PorP/SprF family type IX secretion system membrane protein [Winogradskyella eckloniae]